MNVGIGTEAEQFLFREYINWIFDTVKEGFCSLYTHSGLCASAWTARQLRVHLAVRMKCATRWDMHKCKWTVARDGLTDSSRFCNIIVLLYGTFGDFFSFYDKPCTGNMTKLMLFSGYSDLFLYSKFRLFKVDKAYRKLANINIFLLGFEVSYTFQGCSY